MNFPKHYTHGTMRPRKLECDDFTYSALLWLGREDASEGLEIMMRYVWQHATYEDMVNIRKSAGLSDGIQYFEQWLEEKKNNR